MRDVFDPIRERKLLDGEVGYRLNLSSDFDKAKSLGGLASNAHADLNTAVQSLLVGYDDVAAGLIDRAIEWLRCAIKEPEAPRHYEPDHTEASRHLDLAMGVWLSQGKHDQTNLKEFVVREDRFMLNSKMGSNKRHVSLSMLGYIDTGAYRQALEWFTRAGLRPPESLNSISDEGQICYVICRHRLGQQYYSAAEVEAAIEKFLKRNMNEWLTHGHFLRAAEWMKTIHWQEGKTSLSPKAALLKCYEYLSQVVPPS